MRKNKMLPAGAKAYPIVPSQTNPPRRILVVDDDPFICHRNAEVLIRHGYEVNASGNGADSWEELRANWYHLLVTENELPGLSGLELVRKLRSARMALPVILTTEKLPAVQSLRHLHLHPMVTLLKPYGIADFLDAVRVVLHAGGIDEAEPVLSSQQPPSPAVALQL
jgi:DNA-binding response OmpR family regulator